MSGAAALELVEVVREYGGGRSLLGRRRTAHRAVDGVSLTLGGGATLGIVGESGCGKSTLARMIVGLLPPTDGRILVDNRPVEDYERLALHRKVQMVFQDPLGSLNPRKTVRQILEVPLRSLRGMDAPARRDRVGELMRLVSLRAEFADRYPHEFSGGQRQRIGIARALAADPRLIVADEPVSALDVSIQAQVINLFADLQESLGLTYVFIAHDLSVVRQISDRIAVMYLGKLVEVGPAEDLVRRPMHPYTRALLGSVPVPEVSGGPRAARPPLSGDVPSPIDPPSGCRFHPRCPLATDRCRTQEPLLVGHGPPGRVAACHYPLVGA